MLALAGCLGNDDDSNDDNSGSDSDDGLWLQSAHWANMERIQFNLWNPTTEAGFETGFLFDRITQFLPGALEYEPQLATDWERDGDAVTLNIREGMTWHSGEDFTADDVVNHLHIGELNNFSVWDFVDSVEATGDHTVQYNLSSADLNTDIVLHSILVDDVYTHPEFHREFYEGIEDAATDDEKNEILSDLVEYRIPPEDAVDGVGHGPLKLTDFNDTTLTFEPHEDYPTGWTAGNDLNFDGLKVEDHGEGTEVIYQAAVAGQSDFYRSTPPESIASQLGDQWERKTIPTFGGQAIHFSPDSFWGQDEERSRKVRQAIAHAYDPNQWVQVYGEDQTDLPGENNVNGLAPVQQEQYLSDVLGDFTNYGNADSGWVQMEEAERLMEEAGFERNSSGYWEDTETGEELEESVQFVSAWSDGVPGYQNGAEQLDDFGIRSEPAGQEVSSFLGNSLPSHDFGICMFNFGNGPHPYSAFRGSLGSLEELRFSYTNMREELTVPMPVGEPDGDLETVNVNERIESLVTATDEDEERELVQELAWIVNQWVPFVQAENRSRELGFATDDWDWGDLDKPLGDHHWVQALRDGSLQAK